MRYLKDENAAFSIHFFDCGSCSCWGLENITRKVVQVVGFGLARTYMNFISHEAEID